jgi:hypothetical protein
MLVGTILGPFAWSVPVGQPLTRQASIPAGVLSACTNYGRLSTILILNVDKIFAPPQPTSTVGRFRL